MKQNIYFILLFALFLCYGCGKEAPQKNPVKKTATSKQTVNPKEPEKAKEVVLSAEEFSKSFSKPNYQNNETVKSQHKQKESLPYKIDSIDKTGFANADFLDCDAPSGSLASRLRKKHSYNWLPKWHFVGKGEVYLPAAALSEDKSLLAIVETVPRGIKAKKGSMIILINTYNWTISRIHYFKEKLLTWISFIPGKQQVLVWEEAQLDLKHRSIHNININSGKILSSSKAIPDALSSLAVSPAGDKVFLKTKNKTKILYIFNSEELNKKPIKRKCNMEEGYIAVNGDRLTIIGKEKLTTYKISFPQKVREEKNPTGNIPDLAVFTGSDDKIVYSTYLKQMVLYVGDQHKILSKMAGRVIYYRDDANILAFEEFKNRQINFIRMSDFSLITSLVPERIKPKTQSGALLFTFLPHHDRYMIIDTKGNLCLYHKPGKKWRKQIIFSANKK